MAKLYAEFAELEAYVGLDVANKIRAHFHGIKIYICQTPNPESALVGLIGLEDAQTLGDYMGGDYLRVPSGKLERLRAKAEEDRLQIDAHREAGLTIDEIAAEMDCSDRWIYKLLEKSRPQVDPNQFDMFTPA